MFYDLFKSLCDEKGVSVSKACIEMGLSRSIAAKWKNTRTNPSAEVLPKIAKYFGVTTDYLLTGEQKEKPLINENEELTEYLDELRSRPEKRMLFSVTKNATKAQIEAIVKMIEEMQGN